MPIRVLPENVAAQIAAGEVIERPASVVKELIENALDAGATHIEVEVEGSGISRIRVTDDGTGIAADEVHLALLRHATSKLSSADDLYSIRTLGFRGEALGSIASVARVALTSRAVGAATGMRVVVQGGETLEAAPIGAPHGTVIEVANLFYNVPARRKFLKSETTERRQIANLLMRYALAYPQVRFSLYSDERESFRTAGSGDVADVIVDTLGVDVFRDMVIVEPLENRRPDLPPVRVSGYTTTPSQTRANRSQIILFVNGRSIQDQRLSYAVVQAYHTLIPQGRYPISVLLIELPPEEVDVNVHPTKAEVRFRSPEAVFSAVQRAVRAAVVGLSDTRSIQPAAYVERPWDAPSEDAYEPAPRPAPRLVDPRQLGMDLDTPDPGRRTHQPMPRDGYGSDDEFMQQLPKVGGQQRPRSLPPMRIVGQVAATYIVAEAPAGMYLIDQHAAHERVMYELFMARHEQQVSEKLVQHTLEGAMVELAPLDARHLEECLPILEDLGFVIEPFGQHTFRVRAVPAVLADHDPADLLRRVLQDIESGDAPGAKETEEKIVKRVCKTASVKAGQVLSYDEMLGLLRQLERTQNPHTCPHGRPTMIHLSADELAKEFGRT